MHVEIELVLIGRDCTDQALAFEHPEQEELDPFNDLDPIWIPRSQILNLDGLLEIQLEDGIRSDTYQEVEIEIPLWLAEEKELDMYAEELD